MNYCWVEEDVLDVLMGSGHQTAAIQTNNEF